MGSAELDFTQARIDHDMVEIELDLAGGSVELRLPDGAGASMDQVEVIAGSVEDHRRNVNQQGSPYFRLTGRVRWGSGDPGPTPQAVRRQLIRSGVWGTLARCPTLHNGLETRQLNASDVSSSTKDVCRLVSSVPLKLIVTVWPASADTLNVFSE